MKKYHHLPMRPFPVELEDLLSWPYWPNFIIMYRTLFQINCLFPCFELPFFSGGSSKAKDALPYNCKLACSFAISLLESVSQKLIEGDITIQEVEKINENVEQMERLYDSVKMKTVKSVKGRVHTIVKLKLRDFQAFEEQLYHLHHVCQLATHLVKGI